MTESLRLSLLDLALIPSGGDARQALADATELAQVADRLGRFERLWFAEHHNAGSIASAATSVLIAHVASATSTIRVGAGGVMLPNHSPLVIAEQFGTLQALYGDRIDLGVGRAPGTDQRTLQALRRTNAAAERFPSDVQELQGYLSDETRMPGIKAVPGQGSHVPIYILGSSLFGAQLAAALGLPYAFASHFAPGALHQALDLYRTEFTPSEHLAQPYAIVAANVVAADEPEAAEANYEAELLRRVRLVTPGGAGLTDDEARSLVEKAPGLHARHMMECTAVGGAAEVGEWLRRFAEQTQADELMVTNLGPDVATKTRALQILASL